MASRPPPERPASVQKRLDHFWDVVARLLAKRWLREQQREAESDRRDHGDREPKLPAE